MRKKLFIFAILILTVFMACKKEIDFDYHDIEAFVVVEGRVTNEGMRVVITKSRAMSDSIKGRCQPGAAVVIVHDGISQMLNFDVADNCYRSDSIGLPGHTYQLTIDFEGRHYEAQSTMPAPSVFISKEFLWQQVLDDKLLAFEVWATDPDPDVRNYFWYRMDRKAIRPFVRGKQSTTPFRWSVFDDRGNPPGMIYRDIMCSSERIMDEDDEENWKSILYDGDTLTLQLMTIGQQEYEYYTSLRAGQGGGANPRSNIKGGCQGYFLAGSVSRTDTIVFKRSDVTTVR